MSLARDIVINSQPSATIQGYTGAPVSFFIDANSNKALYYDVINSGSTDFIFSGDANGPDPVIDVIVGDSLTFYINASGHPFYIKTVQGTGSGNLVPSNQIVGATQIVITGGSFAGTYNRVATDYNWQTSNSTLVTGNGRDAYYNAVSGVGIVYDNNQDWYILTNVDLINGTDLIPGTINPTTWGLSNSGAIDYPSGTDATYGTVNFYTSQGNGVQTGSFTWNPVTAGTFYYQCGIHADMTGVINVYPAPSITYDWQKQESGSSTWSSIPVGVGIGQGTPNYATEDLSEPSDDGDRYRCVLSSPLGTNSPLTSSIYTLNVITPVITITQQPSDITTQPGLYANFNVSATVNSPFQIDYQWQLRKSSSAVWNDLGTATSNTLSVPNLDNGDFLRVKLNSTGAQEVISAQAQVNLIPFSIIPGGTSWINPVVSTMQLYTGYSNATSNSAPLVGQPPKAYFLNNGQTNSFLPPVIQATNIVSFNLQGAYKSPDNLNIYTANTIGYYPCPTTGGGGGSIRPTEGLIVPRYGL